MTTLRQRKKAAPSKEKSEIKDKPAASSSLLPLMWLAQFYTTFYEKSPYATLMITNGFLSAIGDLSAQFLESKSNEFGFVIDNTRVLRFLLFGASVGPLGGAWNKYLESKFPFTTPSQNIPMQKVKIDEPLVNPIPEMKLPSGARLERGPAPKPTPVELSSPGPSQSRIAAKRLLMDQLIMAPVSIFIFLFSMSLLEGLDAIETSTRVKASFLPILLVNWKIWPGIQFFNFRFVPLKFRVPFGALCGIFWTCFLSMRTA